MLTPKHRSEVGLWVVTAVIVAVAVVALIVGAHQESEHDRLFQGCLEWCESHGYHETPKDFYRCALDCEEALNEKE
jgi:hypothetical protein